MSRRSLSDANSASRAWLEPRSDQGAFDAWLNRELSRLYDSALREPVPPELLNLLSEQPAR